MMPALIVITLLAAYVVLTCRSDEPVPISQRELPAREEAWNKVFRGMARRRAERDACGAIEQPWLWNVPMAILSKDKSVYLTQAAALRVEATLERRQVGVDAAIRALALETEAARLESMANNNQHAGTVRQ
jgi:hypothetical protein